MKLISNWKESYKFFSNIISFIGLLLMAILADLPSHIVSSWAILPEELKAALPPEAWIYVAMALFILNIVSRAIKQFPSEADKKCIEEKDKENSNGSGT